MAYDVTAMPDCHTFDSPPGEKLGETRPPLVPIVIAPMTRTTTATPSTCEYIKVLA